MLDIDLSTATVSELGQRLYRIKAALGGQMDDEAREALEAALVAVDAELTRRGVL
jgi:hypothetical protein